MQHLLSVYLPVGTGRKVLSVLSLPVVLGSHLNLVMLMKLTFNVTGELALSHTTIKWQGFDQPQDLYPAPWLPPPNVAYPSLQGGGVGGEGTSLWSPWSYPGLSGPFVYGPMASDLVKRLPLCLRSLSAQAEFTLPGTILKWWGTGVGW